jgi:N-acetylmuramic acid 6-phosphate etherase
MGDTETFSARYRGLDTWSDADILEALWEGQAEAVASVRPALPAIAAAARAIAGRIEPDGRMVYGPWAYSWILAHAEPTRMTCRMRAR